MAGGKGNITVTAFIVEYDRLSSSVVLSAFEDHAQALRELRAREAARRPEVELVLLFAPTEGDLRSTHTRYFESAAELARMPRVDGAAEALIGA